MDICNLLIAVSVIVEKVVDDDDENGSIVMVKWVGVKWVGVKWVEAKNGCCNTWVAVSRSWGDFRSNCRTSSTCTNQKFDSQSRLTNPGSYR